jgi:hypothetical protein
MADPIKRPNYFDHQFLKAADFTAEQTYHIGMRRLHNRLFHNWGIVQGMVVTPKLGSPAATVSAGAAVDAAGHEVVLQADAAAPDASAFKGQTVFLTITYQEQITDSNMRSTEAPKIELVAAPADPSLNLVLARLTVDAGGNIASSDAGVAPNSRSAVGSGPPSMVAHSVAFNDPNNVQSTWPRFSAGGAPSTLQLNGGLTTSGDVNIAGTTACQLGGATFAGPVVVNSGYGVNQGWLYMSGDSRGSSFSYNVHRSADNSVYVWPQPTHTAVTMEIDDALSYPRFEIYTTTTQAKTTFVQRFAINGSTGDVTIGANLIAGGDIMFQQSGTKVTSDVRLKEDIQEISGPIDKLAAIRGVSYRIADSASRQRDIGVIAQEVEKVLPELVGAVPQTGMKAVDYGKLNAVLVEGIKQLKNRMAQVRSEIAGLQASKKEPA